MPTALIFSSFIPSYWKKLREPSSPELFPNTSRPNHLRNTHALTSIPRDDYIAQEFISASSNPEVRNFIQALKLHSSESKTHFLIL